MVKQLYHVIEIYQVHLLSDGIAKINKSYFSKSEFLLVIRLLCRDLQSEMFLYLNHTYSKTFILRLDENHLSLK